MRRATERCRRPARLKSERQKAENDLATLLAQVDVARAQIALAERQSMDASHASSLRDVGSGLAAAAETASSALPYVLIVPATDRQTGLAKRIAIYLADNGIKTEAFRPAADARNAPPATHVRYYKATDRVEAARISELAKHAGIRAGVPVFENDPSVQRSRYYVLRLPLSP